VGQLYAARKVQRSDIHALNLPDQAHKLWS
jgi:hypothetical protein